MKILGYLMVAPDNDSYMNPEMYESNICKCLDYIKNRHLHLNPNFELVKKSYDISSTYDSYLIVSNRFREFCLNQEYLGISFYPIPNYPDNFYFDIQRIVRYDAKRRETRFLEYNSECEEYNEVVGATPVCLVDNQTLPDGFFRTDIEFGGSYAKVH